MSETESLKRNNEEAEETQAEPELGEPEAKQSRLETEEEKPNLENGTNENELDTSTETVSTEPCSINIKFHDNLIAELYKTKFIKFINTFTELRVKEDNELSISIFCDKDEAVSPKKRKKKSKVKKELFVVDATPSPTILQNDLRYTTRFTINAEKIEEETTQSSKLGCFNCGSFHSLKDCPEPKDYAKINEARQKFKSQVKPSRYHLEVDQKYGHLQPGKLSPQLRKALGLNKNEAPPYIYQMRQLGYPPGWLEEAKVVHSNLDMFDIDGNNVKVKKVKTSGLDESKIVEYPGFNVPFQKGVKDDYRSYRVPPYSENFSKQAMIDFFDKKFAQEQDNMNMCDMDIDHDPECSYAELTRDSPSLIDLEQQKRQLLHELNDDVKIDTKDSESDSDKGFLTVKTSCFGTPILKSQSPYSQLPNPDNFSKDVSPVINFENLPNSTGKYEQLTNVLQKVRTTLKNINSSCDT